MAEAVVLDCGEYGQVFVDLEQSYVRSWMCGLADDPRGLDIMEAAFEAIQTHRLRYVIIDISEVKGQPSLTRVERLVEMVPAMVRAGVRTQFAVMPGVATKVDLHARTYQATERERGMETIEVPSAQAAIEQIREVNAHAAR